MTQYKVEKCIEGEWYLWNVYDSAIQACYACFELGKSDVDDCRVKEIKHDCKECNC